METNFEYDEFISKDMASAALYKLMIHTILPRPIAWVSTLNENDSVNLAPFSFYNGVTGSPPTIMFSVSRKADGEWKDTYRNIVNRKEFVVNNVIEPAFEAMVDTAAVEPYGVSEVSQGNLTLLPSSSIATPRIAESAVQFECRMDQMVNVPSSGTASAAVIFGEILRIHIRKGLLDDQGRMQVAKLNPVARLGGTTYALLGEFLNKAIPAAK